ncbi:hypothetical protein LCGC14_2743310, partial [marine sediment metagenome]
MKTLTIIGTRPELIRLSEIIKKLDKYTCHIFVYTNQSYDYELSQIFFDELKIRKPNYTLDVKSETVGEQIGKILVQCEQVLLKEKPDAVLILGDTNSALSCIVAKRLKVPIFHMEAGNRCFDDRVPEEINRRIVDHSSDVNLCYTEHARRNLLREGFASQDIFVIGSPLPEVYAAHQKGIEESRILESLKLEKDKYLLASIHREENVENEIKLHSILNSLYALDKEYMMPIILSTHPRTRKKLDGLSIGRIILHKPFGMLDYIKLQQNAFCNLSDSGTAHEDAAILNIPMVIVRESQERPEVYDCGNVIMAGVDSKTILNAVKVVRGQIGVKFDNPYEINNCSDKVVRLIVG